MRRVCAVVMVAGVMFAHAASAGAQQRPLVTEDPETIGSGLVLIEGGFDQQHDVFYPASGLEGNLLRLPTLGVSFGLSSIAELQIDGGLYNRLDVTSRALAPLSPLVNFERRHHPRRRRHRHRHEDPAAVGNRRSAGLRVAFCHAAAECEQRERPRPRHD